MDRYRYRNGNGNQKGKRDRGFVDYYIPPTTYVNQYNVRGYSPGIFDSVTSGHGAISFGTAHGNLGRGLAKFGGAKSRSLWEYLRENPVGDKTFEGALEGEILKISKIYWYPDTFVMFEIDSVEDGRAWKGDAVLVLEGGTRVLKGSVMSCDDGHVERMDSWDALSRFFDEC